MAWTTALPLEIPFVKHAFASTPLRAAVVLLAVSLAGCSALETTFGGDKIDYGKAARKTNPLEVPPDLSPLSRDGRYAPQSGAVSANQLQQQGSSTRPVGAAATVAPKEVGGIRMERSGNTRWLVAPQSPEQLLPRVRQFWQDLGFTLVKDSAEAGVVETDWAENRAKIPSDVIRNTIGKVLDSLYSTGERDKFRTRLERTDRGTEIVISHRGLEEVFTSQRDDSTAWAARGSDPQLEAEMLTRLMVALGTTEEAARQAQAQAATPGNAAATAPAPVDNRVQVLDNQPSAALLVSEDLERTWRRVGLALDRSGFTVEDRDRGQALYFVRFADPKTAGQEAPNFFARMFGAKDPVQLGRFRLSLKAEGSGTVVLVQDAQGQADNSANAKRIATVLAEELRR